MAKAIRFLKIYPAFFKNCLAREMEFRLDFFFGNFRVLLWWVLNVLLLEFIFYNTQKVAGYERGEMLVLFGTFMFVRSFFGVIFEPNLEKLPELIRLGGLDLYLTKPLPALAFIVTRYLEFKPLGQILFSLLMILYGLRQLSLPFSPQNILIYLLFSSLGLLALFSFWLILVSLNFFLRVDETHWLADTLADVGKFPIEIFRGWSRFLLTYLAPLGLIAFLPTKSLIGRLGVGEGIGFLFSVAFLFYFSQKVFYAGLKRYSSGGG